MVEAGMGRFYEGIDLRLRLASPTAEEKRRLAEGIGEDWEPEKSDTYPTLGSITMERPIVAMGLRFKNLLHERPDLADTLRALKLLSAATVLPFTYERIQAILEHIFERRDLHLRDGLSVLAEQSFLRSEVSQGEAVQPEPAYLQDPVTYVQGREPKDDFSKLADVLDKIQDFDGLNSLGVTCFIFEGLPDQALICFNRATALNSGFRSAWLNKGALLSWYGRHDEAVEALNQAVNLEPSNYTGWQNLGAALARAGRREEALEAYRHATALEPDNPNLWREVAKQLSQLGCYGEALEACDRAIALRNDDPETWCAKALTLAKLGQYEEALEAHEQAIDINPDNPQVWSRKGITLSELDRWNEALEAYVRATRLDPTSTAAWTMRIAALLHLGLWQEAVDAADKAIGLIPDNPEYCFYKAQALLKLGRYQEGIKWLCLSWRARERLPDRGQSVARLFAELGYDPARCEQGFPPAASST